jgi:hypothetical protein
MTAEFSILDGQLSFVLHEVPYREPEFTFAEKDRRAGPPISRRPICSKRS